MTTGSRFRLGVDFGTTHTVAALSWPDGRVQPLLFESNPLLPSAVYASDGRRLLVGRDAERSSRVDPARFEPNPKRRIDERVVLLGAEEFRTADLVAAVLHRVYEEAVRVAGGPPAATVLTHPADWAATRLQTLTEAAAQAGIGAVTLVPEPLAAAAYFSATLHREVPVGAALVVYDFGGGTFDISVIRRRPDGGWDVLATEGLDDVGGVDLDAAVVERVGATVSATDPVRWQRLLTAESPEEQRRRRLLWDEVRAAKEQLSRTSVAVVHVPLFDTDVHLTREEFEQLAKPWLERTVALTAATLFRTGLRQDQVAGVVLVGGSTRIPMVGTLLHQRLGVPPTVLDQPELVVAQGSLVGTAGRPAAQNATLPFPGPPPVSAPPAAAPGMGPAGPPPDPGPPMTTTGAAAPPGPAWPG
ncbi:MAG TPA: Hsp70 family protein, partial [Pilimelia sp.]|nr:Hsp70 family protein [Pilimelia sp.]